MKIKYLLALIAASLVFTGCSSLKGLVKNVENDLNNILDSGHGVVTNAASAVTAPLR